MRKYIYSEPFNGTIQNTMSNGIVDYTGDELRTKTIEDNCTCIRSEWINGLTLAEYEKLKGKKFAVADSKEMDILWNAYEDDLGSKPFEEITESKYMYMFECLPPVRYTHFNRADSFFFISEAYTGTLHSLCVKKDGKYYSALRSVRKKTLDLIKDINKNLLTPFKYKIFHNVDGERTTFFNDDDEFISFVQEIMIEDDAGYKTSTISGAINYIETFSEGLTLTLNQTS